MEVRVVPMAGEHLDQLARLEALCFSQPWSRQALEEELQNPAAHFLTALDEGGQVLGYLGLTAVLDESYIANVAVFPHCRGRGVAKALLRAQLDWARERGIATMSLEVRPSNQPAIALYRQFGFREAGRRRKFYQHPTEDGLIMTALLEKDTKEQRHEDTEH